MMNKLPAFLRKPADFKLGSLGDAAQGYQPLLASWLIEMALCLKWYRMSRPHHLPDIFADDDFLALTGITPPAQQDEDGDFSRLTKASEATLIRLLKTRLEELRRWPVNDDLPLFANVELLGGLLGLADAEKAVLTLATVMNHFFSFRNAISARNEHVSAKRLAQIASVLTGQSADGIQAALREDGLLVASGIITIEKTVCDFEQALQLGGGFEGLMMQSHASESDLVKRILKRASSGTLELTAFAHLARDIDALRDYPLHRMLSAKRLYLDARKKIGFDIKDYADEQGHFGTGKMMTFKARVRGHLIRVLEETKLEAKQKLSAPDAEGWRLLTARLRDTWQLRWWVLAQEESIKLIGPSGFRARRVKATSDG